MSTTPQGVPARAPLPLVLGFAVFLVAMVYLLVSSVTRRTAPVFAPTAEARTRSPGWERVGDTLTVDATDGDRWRYVSLEQGRIVPSEWGHDWDLAIRRYNLRVRADSNAIGKWYRYSLLTHLLEPADTSYLVRARGGRVFRVSIVSYYCPGLTAGCVTLAYAPVAGPDSP